MTGSRTLHITHNVLGVRGVGQVGILVPDVRAAIHNYSQLLGLQRWIGYVYNSDNTRDFRYRGRPAQYAITLALAGTAPQVELLSVSGEPNPFTEWIEKHGFGLQHIAVFVDNIHKAIGAMTRSGYETVQTAHGYGLDGDGGFAYFNTVDDLGIIVEAIEVPARRREPDFRFP